ncbi:Bifunctional glyoxylate cycle protein [Triplophysa tibetana]|uniref:malate synthase n=1 Tax=Triplophysa tibetana TaxID=1572043 RepID=A0A5A9NHW5_9TELE|nr:Bifunctional glyoxylate cycle protein [Triplophysa tibetana]
MTPLSKSNSRFTGRLLKMLVNEGIEMETPPPGLAEEFHTLFSSDALTFLCELISTFQPEVDKVLKLRILRKVQLDLTGGLPVFPKDTAHIRNDPGWRVSPVPHRLHCRHVDVGDLSPCDTQRFIQGLKSTAQGLQVDFDDGNCPTYHNQIKGIYNVYQAVHNQFPDVPPIAQAPVLMLRPRAWNMVEHNMMVYGREVPGPLFDFGLLMFHNAKLLLQNQSGPFFYLSKLGLPAGSIKATVLIECVLASFEMEEILYELKEHSAGLNCGIWDYSASFVNKFGPRADFLLPDRSKLKLLEIKAGVDGFMVYDMDLIEPMQKLFQLQYPDQNQLLQLRDDVTVTPEDLLVMPAGGVTLYGLRYNIAVGVLFIEAWLSGRGHFFYLGKVEDSATAEISRSQVWQWIRHQVRLEDSGTLVTRALVRGLAEDLMGDLKAAINCQTSRDEQRLMTAVSMFLEIVQKNDFPEFLTTYLNLDHTFLSFQNQHEKKHTNKGPKARL